MSTPNPLIPQGTFQAQAAKGATNVRLAVASIVAIHIVFFGGLLLQGCKRDPETTAASTEQTNNAASTTNLALAPLDSSSLFYPTGGVPSEVGTGITSQASLPPDSSTYGGIVSTQPTNAEALWQTTNLTGAGTEGTLTTAAESGAPTTEYTIVRGDTMGAIANRNHVTLSALRNANPGVDPRKIRPGQKLQIPAPESTPAATPNGASVSATTPNGSGKTYTVKSGDTLTKIARNHGVTVSQLRAANNLRTSRVNVGQKLKIPAGTNASTVAAPEATPGL